ncbi:MAG: 30S ribosomal protein S18 [bacterium]
MRKDSRNKNNQLYVKKKKICYFCKEKIEEIDYQNNGLLSKYLDYYNRIRPGSSTGTCTKHQRQLGKAIKRARSMALLSYV